MEGTTLLLPSFHIYSHHFRIEAGPVKSTKTKIIPLILSATTTKSYSPDTKHNKDIVAAISISFFSIFFHQGRIGWATQKEKPNSQNIPTTELPVGGGAQAFPGQSRAGAGDLQDTDSVNHRLQE